MVDFHETKADDADPETDSVVEQPPVVSSGDCKTVVEAKSPSRFLNALEPYIVPG